MSTFSDTSPVLIKKRKGDSIDPFIPITENLKIIHNIAVLNEIPDKFKKVNIEGMFEKQTDFYNENNNIGENEYIVDYKLGYVFFNEKVNNTTVKANYLGTGFVLYPSSRIYDTGRTDIIVTIQEMIDGGRKAIEAYGSIDKAIEVVKEYYLKINTTIDLAKKTDGELNITIVNGNNINNLLNNTIQEAINTNNTLGGTADKIIEMDNKIKEVDDNETIRQTNETQRINNEKTREAQEITRQQGYTNIKNTIDDFSICETYDSTKDYKKFNRATFNGNSYEAIKNVPKGVEPTNIDYWICIAQKGKDGTGSGNMHTDDYDKNVNGVVDKAESISDGVITYTAQDIKTNLDKIGVLSTLEKEIVDNLTTEKKEINLTNAINYLYQNGGSNNNVKEYGVRWTKSTDTIERLGSAIGKTAITGGQNDFSSLMPWSGMKRCNLSDNGVVNAYYGSPAYKVDGSNGQVVVEIPKYWYKVVNVSDDVIEFWICDGAKSGYEVHPAFFRDRQHLCDDNSGNATEVNYRYIGAYEATEYTGSVYQGGNGYNINSPSYNSSYKLSSVSGYYPIANRNLSEFRTLAKNRGNGWGQQDYYLTYAIQLLYLIEYAHFNSQGKIGNGNSNSSTILKTGATDSYGNNSYGTTANTITAMSYRGIENFYANVYKWIDGLYSDSNRKVFFANKGFTDICTNYNNSYATGLPSNIDGYISDIWGDKTTGFIPKVVSGSETTKLCDYGSLYGDCVAVFGGGYGSGAGCGCFCLGLYYSPSSSSWDCSARLAF